MKRNINNNNNNCSKDFLTDPFNQPPPPPQDPIIDLNLNSSCYNSHLIHSVDPQLLSRKRLLEQQINDGDGVGKQRHKRMIKNRESAARSRARKQAYTYELEMEVGHLEQENAKLKRQFQELRAAMAAQIPTKKKLHRTSSCLF